MSLGREDVRLDLDMQVTVNTVYDEQGIIVPTLKDIKMIVTNLSATGVSLQCEKEFNDRTSFMLELELNGEEIRLMPVIVRISKEGKVFNYGCKLMHLDPHEEQVIRNFIFTTQLNKRRFKK